MFFDQMIITAQSLDAEVQRRCDLTARPPVAGQDRALNCGGTDLATASSGLTSCALRAEELGGSLRLRHCRSGRRYFCARCSETSQAGINKRGAARGCCTESSTRDSKANLDVRCFTDNKPAVYMPAG